MFFNNKKIINLVNPLKNAENKGFITFVEQI